MTDLVSIQTEMSNNKKINIPINYRITFNIKRTQCSVTERAASSVRKGRERGWGGGGEGREVAPGRLVRPTSSPHSISEKSMRASISLDCKTIVFGRREAP